MNARVGIEFLTNTPEVKKAAAEIRRAIEHELNNIQPRIKPAKVPPSTNGSGTSGGKSTGGKSPDEKEDERRVFSAVKARAAIEREEKKIDAVRSQFRNKTAREQKELTNNLVNEQSKLQSKNKAIYSAMQNEHDKYAKKILAQERKKVQEQIRINDQVLKERPEVQRGGMGSKVGILGTFRNVIPGAGKLDDMISGVGGAKGGGMKGGMMAGGAMAAVAGLTALAGGMQTVIEKGAALETQSADLSAITGLLGKDLQNATKDARELGIKYNIDATQGVESMKLVISALGPEVAKNRQVLKGMTDTTLEFAKAASTDAATATDILTVTISQFGFATADSATQAKQMERASNLIAAAAKEGAAEAEDLGLSMKEAGATAYNAGLSMEQTAAFLEMLAPAGLKAEKAGIAMRNILLKMSAGSKFAAAELSEMGLTFDDINPKAVGITKGLQNLRDGFAKVTDPVQRATALQKLFGLENANAAEIIMSSADSLDLFTSKITATNAAQEMAATKMATMAERWGRFQRRIEDIAYTIFEQMTPALEEMMTLIEQNSGSISTIGTAIADVTVGLIDFIKWMKGANDSLKFFMHDAAAAIGIVSERDVINRTVLAQRRAAGQGNQYYDPINRSALDIKSGKSNPININPVTMQPFTSGVNAGGEIPPPFSGSGGGGKRGGGSKSKKQDEYTLQDAINQVIKEKGLKDEAGNTLLVAPELTEDAFNEMSSLFDTFIDDIAQRNEKIKALRQDVVETNREATQEEIDLALSQMDNEMALMEEGAEKEVMLANAKLARELIVAEGNHNLIQIAQMNHETAMQLIRKKSEDEQLRATQEFYRGLTEAAKKGQSAEFMMQQFGLNVSFDAIRNSKEQELALIKQYEEGKIGFQEYQQEKSKISHESYGNTILQQIVKAKGTELAVWISTEWQKTAATEAGVFERLALTAKEVWAGIKAAAVSMYEGVASAVKWILELVPFPFSLALIPGAALGVYGAWQGIKALFDPETELAEGGILTRPTFSPLMPGGALGGEAGAEAVIPLKKLPSILADSLLESLANDSKNGGFLLGLSSGGTQVPVSSGSRGGTTLLASSISARKPLFPGSGSNSAKAVQDIGLDLALFERFMSGAGYVGTGRNYVSDLRNPPRFNSMTSATNQLSAIADKLTNREIVLVDAYGVEMSIAKAKQVRERNEFN